MTKLQDLESQKYISLETYKKNTQSVKTPVWFVIDSELLYVVTREQTGKVKRIKNNPSVKIAPCSFRGKSTGEWISGNASKVEGKEGNTAIKLRKKKYRFMARIAGFASRGKGDLVVYSIKLDSD
ncbi:MAG TPA: PPOX class F420-dependent oxidoreductase [Nitrosopumilaceae archaeon]|jgi:PPOX class probable F420-dependent enzyme|nr:PPOX class F420-dependent oxidoreductase [Nitrosopumilaceae archaeon]